MRKDSALSVPETGKLTMCTWLEKMDVCVFYGCVKKKITTELASENNDHLSSHLLSGFPGGSEVKASASSAGEPGSIPGSGRSPGEGNGNPLQYSCLETPMDGEARLQPTGSQRVRHD